MGHDFASFLCLHTVYVLICFQQKHPREEEGCVSIKGNTFVVSVTLKSEKF